MKTQSRQDQSAAVELRKMVTTVTFGVLITFSFLNLLLLMVRKWAKLRTYEVCTFPIILMPINWTVFNIYTNYVLRQHNPSMFMKRTFKFLTSGQASSSMKVMIISDSTALMKKMAPDDFKTQFGKSSKSYRRSNNRQSITWETSSIPSGPYPHRMIVILCG